MVTVSSNFKDLLNQDFNVIRRTRTSTDSGGFENSFPVVGTVTGRMSVSRSRGVERTIGGKLQVEITHVFFTLPTEDIRRDDILEQISGGDLKVRVITVTEPSEMDHHIECECQELEKNSVPTT